MVLSLNNLIESICNPTGRFKRLRNMSVCLDDEGDPLFSYRDFVVSFWVQVSGQRYLLKSYLRGDTEREHRWRSVACFVQEHRSVYLPDFQYFNDEMLVFGEDETFRWIDVVLVEHPWQMLTLDQYLEQIIFCQDQVRLRELLNEFCKLSRWLAGEKNLIHGMLRPSHLLVEPQKGTLCLAHCETMRDLSAEQADDEALRDEDNLAMAHLALSLRALIDMPQNFRTLRGNPMFHHPGHRSSLLPVFEKAATESGCEPMLRLIHMLECSSQTLRGREVLTTVLDDMAADRTRVLVDLTKTAQDVLEEIPIAEDPVKLDFNGDSDRLSKRYDVYGELRENLLCVMQDKKYGFINEQGEEVIALKYDWADDFNEGRAVVQMGCDFGLIDKEGREILPPIYETVEWNCDQNVVKVESDGYLGLCDRNGEVVVPFEYQWMGDIDAPLIAVCKRGRYGYIGKDGTELIPFEYDEAFGFRGGRAIVERDGRSFYIDEQGREIGDM